MTSRKPQKKSPASDTDADSALSQQYGGKHTGGWVSSLPASWVPYIQLARLSPPAGVFLVFFPHLFGVAHAAVLLHSPLSHTLRIAATLTLGSFFVSNAIHGWNDLVDAPLDAMVARTRNRPIPRGAVSPFGAFVFTATQLLAAAALLPFLPEATAWAVVPSVLVNFYYPWSKRHTHAAQLVLGVSLAWGVYVGAAAMGVEGLLFWGQGEDWASTTCLFGASALWTVIYDTIYAFQDVADDEKIGIKSTAVFFRAWTKPFLWTVLAAVVGLLGTYGAFVFDGEVRVGYYLVVVGGSLLSLGAMIAKVDLDDPLSCWLWFRYGFWLAGGSIAGGLLLQYAMVL
ncbi:UbiA prenyltransferase family-domain-containing protein [Bombardia bombarda]|uniref:UbiA prenyltransferase family-domain-containing protein n=1 Tax=Bombardia bombarda TaxID=252184 RepID=A0AA39WH77_9PEZI|nr:UbiA prenyltransferase family-domain-containing protein [Bombardia bombarda]